MARTGSGKKQPDTQNIEAILWAAADKLRGHMDAAEYKHVVLGLIFLKYISDAFEERHAELVEEFGIETAEERDEYTAEGIFWVPEDARWSYLKANAKQPGIGTLIDGAMEAIEKANSKQLLGVLPRGYGRPALDKQRLGELVDLISSIGLGEKYQQSQDVLGGVYEYFLSKFASAEGKQGGEFYTPRSVVNVLTEMLSPYKGRVYDPCCGSGGMFILSEKFVAEHGGQTKDISIFGQESNNTTWKLARMNLAIRGIEADLGSENADTFHRDLHPDLRADYILANPPFNVSDWGGDRLREDKRWQYGTPPIGNANYAWVQHFLFHLAPNGIAGFVLANGSLSSNTSGEGEIRKNIIEADLVDCIIAMPGQLFYSTQIPVSLWFLAKNKKNGRGLDGAPLRNRTGETLFIDARELGRMDTRIHRVLDPDDIALIAGTYYAWRGDGEDYEDVPGFCKSASTQELQANGFVLTPGRYVGAATQEDSGEPLEERLRGLTQTLFQQMNESSNLDIAIRSNLMSLLN